MAEKVSVGQRDKTAAEERTAQVGAESQQDAARADSAADKLDRARNAGVDTAAEVAYDPYPTYEGKSADELRSYADSRDVEINRDVEKAELVKLIRAKDPTNAALDFMPLEQLRSLASEKDMKLSDEFVTAQLVTELRAADTGVNNPARHVR